jgi:putative ABC transport system permease protein
MSRLLWRSSLRYITSHRVQGALSILGVALGVAVVFSIDLVTQSSRTAFRLSTEAVTGRATHHVIGGSGGITEAAYRHLRVDLGFRASAPLVEGYVAVDAMAGRALQLVGVDPFAEAPFRAHLGALTGVDLGAFILSPAVYMPDGLCDEFGIVVGDTIEIRTPTRRTTVTLIGRIDTESRASRGLENVILADISTAQEVLGQNGRLSRIDLILPTDNNIPQRLRQALPAGTDVIESALRTNQVEKMTSAFSRNLFSLSLLALVVGMFLIYNTMTFSVVQRRALIGDLRTLGVTRREIFSLVLSEAAAIGAIGTLLGLLLGFALSRVLLDMVTRTINDLYFVLSVSEVYISPAVLTKAVAMGLGATVLSASIPARDATHTAPSFVQNRSVSESRARDLIPRLSVAGLALLVIGAVMLWAPVRHHLVSYLGLPPLIAGFALLTPGALVLAVASLPSILKRAMGFLGRMAIRAIVSQLSRASVAIAALAIAVGTTVGVTTMVGSFRQSVVQWLEVTLDAGLYVSPPTLVSSRNDDTLDPALVQALTTIDGVTGANYIRSMLVETGRGIANLAAIEQTPRSEQRFRFIEGEAVEAWKRLKEGQAIVVSEPYAYRYKVDVGDSVILLTADGYRAFGVVGVYRDCASDIGTVLLDRAVYRRHWHDDAVSGVGLFLDDSSRADDVRSRIHELAGSTAGVVLRSNQDLRELSIEVFDRTFAITNVLRMLTVVVAFVGVLSALMALQLERAREFGVLRALGLTPGQLWRLVTLQTGVMGFLAGIIALPFGLILAAVLTLVINKRSFGWTLELQLSPEVFVQAVLLAVVAALLAGVYPSYKMSRTSPARALREE